VQNVISLAPVSDVLSVSGHWISTGWLEEWCNSINPSSAIDNSKIICPHGNLDPGKRGRKKRLQIIWYERYGKSFCEVWCFGF
jgi:hypothetical protein